MTSPELLLDLAIVIAAGAAGYFRSHWARRIVVGTFCLMMVYAYLIFPGTIARQVVSQNSAVGRASDEFLRGVGTLDDELWLGRRIGLVTLLALAFLAVYRRDSLDSGSNQKVEGDQKA
jgi:hypothetical protein